MIAKTPIPRAVPISRANPRSKTVQPISFRSDRNAGFFPNSGTGAAAGDGTEVMFWSVMVPFSSSPPVPDIRFAAALLWLEHCLPGSACQLRFARWHALIFVASPLPPCTYVSEKWSACQPATGMTFGTHLFWQSHRLQAFEAFLGPHV